MNEDSLSKTLGLDEASVHKKIPLSRCYFPFHGWALSEVTMTIEVTVYIVCGNVGVKEFLRMKVGSNFFTLESCGSIGGCLCW